MLSFAAKTIDRLLQLPLTTKEEQLLVSYLMDSSEPRSQEMLVMHYLQKARFTEAIQLNDKLKHAVLVSVLKGEYLSIIIRLR